MTLHLESTGFGWLSVGLGQFKQLPILDATTALLAQRGVPWETASTPAALARYGELTHAGKRVAAILHITC